MFSQKPPDCLQDRLAVVFFVLLLWCILAGCSGSSPRFKGRNATTGSESTSSREHSFATKIRKEETAEDDKKVDVEEVKKDYTSASPSTERSSPIDRKKAMTEILGLIGTPYALGGTNDDGMDCSSFTSQIYSKAVGQQLPRETTGQYKVGKSVGSGRLKFGDLVFFNTTGESPSHVGIFIGDDLFAHASVSYGVTISSLQSSYYKKRYIGARRVVE